ncbi:hypothetical protein ES319_A04G071600v1 [Gossypium barbadense]|uniref:Activator of Hsp90 ATPase AHSA1-like N-terminal domain-containing protein n=2 Tax=Gossypium TaxID=3633 RepID=A0A5J5W629_GOSBA|nr:hypothetical protein ES319_A04G071600v1 [Gossypium barbadense]TYH21876.1 hypothetical protein ES288_A04G081000v1 [Gossypium darwinii]
MAKYGEGDKRWIVEERPDGANVHNWHWAETDCLPWSKTFFTKSLSDLTILDCQGILSIKTKKVEKVDGEAYVNVRKGKIIPGYEISLSLSWEGEAKDGEGKTLLKAEGNLEIPYISDENADEDPEVKVTTKDEGPIGKALKEAMLANGKPLVLEKVILNRLRKILTTTTSNSNSAAMSKEKVGVEKEAKKEVKKEGKKGFKTITMSEKFNCRAKDMYEILMDENRWKGFSQSNARISKEVGGQFSIFDGSVTGINLELEEGKLIAQRWRFGSWSDGIDSTVRLVFNEPEPGVTVIKLTHSDVPEEDRYGNATVVENTERGWRDLIFNKIRAVFGFGI